MVAKQIQSEIRQGLHEGIDLASVKHLLNKRIMYYRTVASSDDLTPPDLPFSAYPYQRRLCYASNMALVNK